jgi:hypothetical protein
MYGIALQAIANSGTGVVELTNKDAEAYRIRNSRSRQIIVYKSTSTDEKVLFSDRRPDAGEVEILRYHCFACNPDSKVNWHTIALNTSSYNHIVLEKAAKYGVDPAWVRAVMHAESAFNHQAHSGKGAQGLMQLMPATARELGVVDAFDVAQNIDGGAKYLAYLYTLFQGDVRLATAAYNAGPGAVKRYKGVPPYAETEVYVDRVGILHQRYKQALSQLF